MFQICPYYASSKKLIKEADLVFCPYNYIIGIFLDFLFYIGDCVFRAHSFFPALSAVCSIILDPCSAVRSASTLGSISVLVLATNYYFFAK